MIPMTGYHYRCAPTPDRSERIDALGLTAKSIGHKMPRHPTVAGRGLYHSSYFSGTDEEGLAVVYGSRAQRVRAGLSYCVPRQMRVELHAARPPPGTSRCFSARKKTSRVVEHSTGEFYDHSSLSKGTSRNGYER